MVARIRPRLCCTTATAQPGVVVAACGAGASGAAGTPPQAPARGGTSPARPDRQRTVTLLWKTELYCSSKHAHSRLRLQTRPGVALAPSTCAVRLPCSSAARDGRAGTCPGLGALTRLPGPAQPQRYQPCRSCWPQEPPGKQLVGPQRPPWGSVPSPLPQGAWPAWPLPRAAAAGADASSSLPHRQSATSGPGTHAAAPKPLPEVTTAQRQVKGWSTAWAARPADGESPKKHLWSGQNVSRKQN